MFLLVQNKAILNLSSRASARHKVLVVNFILEYNFMLPTRSARLRKTKHLIGLTLLAELQTNKRNLLSLILDKTTLWKEDRQVLKLPPLPKSVEMLQPLRSIQLKNAVFSLANKRPVDAKRIIFRDAIYQPSLNKNTTRH